MTNVANFKVEQVKAFTKQEAASKASFQIIKDATQAWKNAGSPLMGKELKEFCAEYLQKHTKMLAGIGCSITVETGVADSRERPYKIEDIKNELGKRKYKTGYQGINPETGEILFTCFETKEKAKEVARTLYTKKGYTGDITCRYIKEVVEGQKNAFDVKHCPSINSKLGTYLMFGVLPQASL